MTQETMSEPANTGKNYGVLYITAGKRYIDAAIRSAHTVRQHSPSLKIHLFANWREYGYDFDKNIYPFTSIGEIDHPHRRSKVDFLPLTPFERTLYLDSDTAIVEDITGMFDLLDRFDIALCHGMRRNFPARLATWNIEISKAFPQYNGGVILYRGTPEVIRFMESWRDAYYANLDRFQMDQRTLRELLWLSDLRMAVLPPEYNVRYIKYHYLWSKQEATSKILHLQKFHITRGEKILRWLDPKLGGLITKLGMFKKLDERARMHRRKP